MSMNFAVNHFGGHSEVQNLLAAWTDDPWLQEHLLPFGNLGWRILPFFLEADQKTCHGFWCKPPHLGGFRHRGCATKHDPYATHGPAAAVCFLQILVITWLDRLCFLHIVIFIAWIVHLDGSFFVRLDLSGKIMILQIILAIWGLPQRCACVLEPWPLLATPQLGCCLFLPAGAILVAKSAELYELYHRATVKNKIRFFFLINVNESQQKK